MTDLRDYQAQAIEQLEKATKALYVLPTGGGKTVIAIDVMMRSVQRGERALMLTHRREILRQTSLKIPIDHGLIQAGLNIDLEYPVQVASIQTLWARCMRSNKVSLPPADLIIIDEAHHIAARTWRLILEAYPNARRIGLTATPCRADGRGLGNYFERLILGPQIPELIARKYLVPTVYYAPANPDLKGVETRQGDYVVSQLADRMNRDDLVGDIVSNWHKLAQRRKTLVFCVDVAHSVHVKNEFLKSDVKAEHVDGGTPKAERDAILARLASGETEVLCNCMVLTEGFDLPAISCIVLARPTKQLGLFRQMAGRGLRPAPGKSNLVLIDHSGAVFRHGLLEDPNGLSTSPSGPRTRRTKSVTSRKSPDWLSVANAAHCVLAAKHVRTVAFCRNDVLTRSFSRKVNSYGSTRAEDRSIPTTRTNACGGMLNCRTSPPSAVIEQARWLISTRKNSAVGRRSKPSSPGDRRRKC